VSNDTEMPVLYLFLMHLLSLSATVNQQVKKYYFLTNFFYFFALR